MPLFERQGVHLLFLGMLIGLTWRISNSALIPEATCLGLTAKQWFVAAVLVAAAHQVYIWLAWRTQLQWKLLTRLMGRSAFYYYTAVFSVFLLARLLTILCLAIASRNSLELDGRLLRAVSVLILIPPGYVLWSIARYFGFKRAFGADHFFEEYRNKPLVKQGAFRYTVNAMYVFAFLVFWVPGFYFASKAALLAASIVHAYIWVHFYCTEKPDMKIIYGTDPA